MAAAGTPQELMKRAEWLTASGRLSEAAETYNQLLKAWPNLPNSWYNFALIQRRLGRFEEALRSYQRALDLGITQPEEVHLNRGVIFADDLRRDADAEAELNKALALNPAYVPALLNLANLREDGGERQAALGIYERILALDPNCHEALARAAGAKTIATRDDPLVERLRRSLADNRVGAADKANLGFALGKALDQCGDYDGAFEAYVAANRNSRSGAGPGRARYDRLAHERLIDELIAAFPLRQPTPTAELAKPPVFICGMFRSGSTLVEQVLASHPRVTAGGELNLLPALASRELAPFPARMKTMSADRLADLAKHYLDHVAKLFPAADLVTDKRPDNFLYIGLIKRLFPTAKIIHTTRDPLDNCLSIFFLHLDHSMSYALDLADTGHYYRQYRRLMEHWKQCFGDDIIDFDYDTFVRDPRPSVAKLLSCLNLEWNEACLRFHETKNAVKTASVWQVREPLYDRSSGRWRNYDRHLGRLRESLAGR